VVLLLDRLLDLEDQVRRAPDVVGGGEDPRPGRDELVVADGGADAGVLLDVDLVTVGDQLMHADGRDGDAVLVVLDFLRNADLHL
jgi:hypothetical protein